MAIRIGMGACRFDGQPVRFRVAHHRVDHRATDAGGLHSRQGFLLRIGCLAVMGGWCAFGPEVDLSVNNRVQRRRWLDGYGLGGILANCVRRYKRSLRHFSRRGGTRLRAG
jgi:hypothetical protein